MAFREGDVGRGELISARAFPASAAGEWVRAAHSPGTLAGGSCMAAHTPVCRSVRSRPSLLTAFSPPERLPPSTSGKVLTAQS